jgi:hypothetical protein
VHPVGEDSPIGTNINGRFSPQVSAQEKGDAELLAPQTVPPSTPKKMHSLAESHHLKPSLVAWSPPAERAAMHWGLDSIGVDRPNWQAVMYWKGR